MDIEKFINRRPYLYHLTSTENIPLILKHQRLFSANRLIDMSSSDPDWKRSKRKIHHQVDIDGKIYHLRDQRPISEKALSKCLTNGWNVADYLEHLNNRVFTWPTLDRLWRHYKRYVHEDPGILRFNTSEAISLNPHVQFCRLNSGATRPSSYLGGIPPERGIETFLPSENYLLSIGSVAEVTFEQEFILPNEFYISNSPEGEWVLVNL